MSGFGSDTEWRVVIRPIFKGHSERLPERQERLDDINMAVVARNGEGSMSHGVSGIHRHAVLVKNTDCLHGTPGSGNMDRSPTISPYFCFCFCASAEKESHDVCIIRIASVM
jgi:hypothetical protein